MKPLVPSEHHEQATVIAWWSMYAPLKHIDDRLLFAIPNGIPTSLRMAAKFKKEGLRAGVPDLFLALPRNGKSGLFIEMKRVGGKVKAGSEQEAFCALLQFVGFKVVVAAGADEAMKAITEYLKGEKQ